MRCTVHADIQPYTTAQIKLMSQIPDSQLRNNFKLKKKKYNGLYFQYSNDHPVLYIYKVS